MSKQKGIYLVAQYFQKPKDHVNTSVKGWMNDPANIRYDEKVAIVRGLKNRDLNAQIVLNLGEKKVERNSFNGTKDFDEIFRYFFENYDKYIVQVMGQIDPDYLRALVDKMQAEIEATDQPVDVVATEVEPTVEEAQAKWVRR